MGIKPQQTTLGGVPPCTNHFQKQQSSLSTAYQSSCFGCQSQGLVVPWWRKKNNWRPCKGVAPVGNRSVFVHFEQAKKRLALWKWVSKNSVPLIPAVSHNFPKQRSRLGGDHLFLTNPYIEPFLAQPLCGSQWICQEVGLRKWKCWFSSGVSHWEMVT
jgi:hypothetical protein